MSASRRARSSRPFTNKGVNTLSQLKEATRASTGCGSCTSLCQDILRAVAPDFEEEAKKVLCGCVPFSQDNLREILRSQRLKSVQEVLDIYGNGQGCEVCKPALSYMLDMIWCGDHDEDRSARFINDRVHANIQKDGTFSVVPRIRGGVTSPAELRRIADVADKYQRADGEDHRQPAHRSARDQERRSAEGLGRSRHAVRPGVHEGRAHGEDVRRHRVLPLRHAGLDVAPASKWSGGSSTSSRRTRSRWRRVGCPRNCAEATVKDIGLVGQEGGWQVVVGGAAGKSVRKADLLITVETTEAALEAAELFFQYYREQANYLERTYDFVERVGIDKVRKETVYATEAVKQALLDRLQKSKAASHDAWLEGQSPVHPTQFIPLQPIESGARHEQRTWIRIAPCDSIPPREGRAAVVGGREIAIFNLGDRFLAVDNRCPHQSGPLCDGIVAGDAVVCPLHAWKVNLETGAVAGRSTGTTASGHTRRAWMPASSLDRGVMHEDACSHGFFRRAICRRWSRRLLYFDVSFMVWVILGPLAPFLREQFGLSATAAGTARRRAAAWGFTVPAGSRRARRSHRRPPRGPHRAGLTMCRARIGWTIATRAVAVCSCSGSSWALPAPASLWLCRSRAAGIPPSTRVSRWASSAPATRVR